MSKHSPGDGPIEDAYIEKMNAVAHALDELFNEPGKPKETGFILLIFPFGEKEGRCNYISNGARREDVSKLLKEQAGYFDADIAKDKRHD